MRGGGEGQRGREEERGEEGGKREGKDGEGGGRGGKKGGERERSVTAYSRSVFRNKYISSMWLTPTRELNTPLTGSSSLPSRQVNTAVTITVCSRFRILVLN